MREVIAAYLFGSHARGTTHAESDVDVAVLLDRTLLATRGGRRAFADQVATRLADATHQDRVDVVVLNDAPPELAVQVLDTGILVRKADPEATRAFGRDARLRLADLRPFLDRTRRVKLKAIIR